MFIDVLRQYYLSDLDSYLLYTRCITAIKLVIKRQIIILVENTGRTNDRSRCKLGITAQLLSPQQLP